MNSVGEQYPIEQARCRELLKHYHAIGPAGGFGAVMLEGTLKEADEAAISGDVVRIVRAFKSMQSWK